MKRLKKYVAKAAAFADMKACGIHFSILNRKKDILNQPNIVVQVPSFK